MELKHIESFVVLAQELSFSKAAKKLHLSQSPLSRHIKLLEKELGKTLFQRSTQSVQLTKAGEVFLEEATMLLSQVKGAMDKLKAPIKTATKQLEIGFIRPAMLLFLPQLIKAFRQQYPHIQLNITEMNQAIAMQKGLLNRTLDVVFMHALLPLANIETHLIFYEPLKLVLPQKHPLADKQVISLPELQYESFIMFPRHVAPAMYDLFLFECAEKARFEPNILMEADPQIARIELVAHNLGITFASAGMEKMFGDEVVFKNVVSTNLVHFPMDLAWNPNNITPSLQAFISFTQSFTAAKEGTI
ncbi:hypothetical protein BKI52_22800 [marine bacterium AO1-C]|nr:hypothetical protein BKI52_22800 [marine bacterium AO1-C]